MVLKIFKDSVLYALAPQLPKIVSLALMPVITKYVTAQDYGIYGLVGSYIFIIGSLKDLGFGVLFVNTFYKYPTRWQIIWRMLYGHLIFWSVIYLLLFLLLLYIALPKTELHNYWLIAFLVGTPAIILDNTNSLGSYYYRFSRKPGFIAIVTVITGVVTVLVTYYSIVVLRLGYLGWFFGTFAGGLTTFMFFVYPVYFTLNLTPIVSFRKRIIFSYLKVSLPMIPHNYSSYLLNSSDRVMLDLFKVNTSVIGIYNIAYLFGNYFEAIGEAIGMAVGPYYSKLFVSNSPKDLNDERNLTFFLMIGFIAAAFLVSLWLKEVFLIMIKNEELQSAYYVGIPIIMGYAYRPMYWSSGNKLSIAEKTGSLWKISFVAGVINVILNFIFIPSYGIMAASVNTFISLQYIGFIGFALKAYREMNGPSHYPLFWLSVVIALTITAYSLKDVSIVNKLIITTCALSIFGFGEYKLYKRLKAISI